MIMDEMSIADGIKQLIDDGVKSLEIYWIEDIKNGDEVWWIDIHEDALCEVCDINWIWDVLSQQQVDCDDDLDDYYGSLETDIIVDESFSEDVVKDAVGGWLQERGLDIDVKVVSPNGRIAMERILEGLAGLDDAIPLDEFAWDE